VRKRNIFAVLIIALLFGLSLTSPIVHSEHTTASMIDTFSTNSALNVTGSRDVLVYNQSLHSVGITIVPPYPSSTANHGAVAADLSVTWPWPVVRLDFWIQQFAYPYSLNVTADIRTGAAPDNLGTIIQNSTTIYNVTTLTAFGGAWTSFYFSPAVNLTTESKYDFVVRDAAQGGSGSCGVKVNYLNGTNALVQLYSFWGTSSDAMALRIYENFPVVNSTIILSHPPESITIVTVNGTSTTNYSTNGSLLTVNDIDADGPSTIVVTYVYPTGSIGYFSQSFSTAGASNITWSVIQCVYNQSAHETNTALFSPYPTSGSDPVGVAQVFTVNWTAPLYTLEFYLAELTGTFNVTADIRTGISGGSLGTIVQNSTTIYNSTSLPTYPTGGLINFTFIPLTLINGNIYDFVVRDAAQGGSGEAVVYATSLTTGRLQELSYWEPWSYGPTLLIFTNHTLVNSTVALSYGPISITNVTVNGGLTTDYSLFCNYLTVNDLETNNPSIIVVHYTYYMPTIGDFYAPSTYPNIPFLLNVTVSYPDGNTYFCNTTVTIGDVTLLWINVTDSFSEYADPNDYCTLTSGSSVVINLTSIRLSWNVTFTWNWPEGVKSPSGVVWVFSVSYKFATNLATDLFTFTSDLAIYSVYAEPFSPFLGSTFYIVSTIYFQGTAVAPPNTGQVTFYAFRSGVADQTTTIDVYGRARILVSASVVGTYEWLIYAVTPAGTSVQNQTVTITIYSSGAPPSGPGGPTTPSQVAQVTFYGSLVSLGNVARGQQISIPITITWVGASQITVTNMSFIGPEWSVTFPQLPKTFYIEFGVNNGTATLTIFVTVPDTTSLGSQQITVVVSAEGGIPPSQSQISCVAQFTVVLPPIQSSPYTVQTIVGALLAGGLGASLFIGARKKRKSPV